MDGVETAREPSWLPEERRHEIGRRVRATGHVEVADLAQVLGVSQETVRRDLEVLAERGMVERTHGGAVAPSWAGERSFAERTRWHADAKRRMAEMVAGALADVHRIVLDSGSSTAAVAAMLRERTGLEVITNSLPVATTLAGAEGVRVLVVGGLIRKPTLSLVGEWANAALGSVRAGAAVLGVNGVSAEYGLFTPTLEEATTKRALLEAASEVWAVADASKFTRQPEGHRFATWSDVHHFVTERGAPPDEIDRLLSLHLDIRVV